MTEEIVEFSNEEETPPPTVDVASFSDAVLWGTDWTVETIVAQLRRQNIEINPRFQRRDAWTRSAKSKFVESIILGLPIPQVVLAELPDQRGKYIILDGKQRLLSLLQFSGLGEGPNNGFSLSGLEVRTDLARKRFRHLERDVDLQNDLNAFLTHTIRAVVIRNWPSLDFLHIVFQRLNTGSLKLSPQELRQALAPGSFTYFADDSTVGAEPVHRLLGRSGPDPRMRDVELLVRFIAFRLRLEFYTGRMKDFLDTTCVDLNRSWDAQREIVERETAQFILAIEALEAVLGERLARKRHSRLFNRSIFDVLSYYAAVPDVRDAMLAQPGRVIQAYEAVVADEVFQAAIESDTAGIPHTSDRLRVWGEALQQHLNIQIAIPTLRERDNGELRFVR
ncbi:DUF262 domain-containing protein [Brevundimonas sp. LjRoot202]|uniref:DUF262 domain-containing protein n=1 Tax=Brevundimonas sp. LjRoot202 TaxID=3342281 RepID=UPI003ECDD2ED